MILTLSTNTIGLIIFSIVSLLCILGWLIILIIYLKQPHKFLVEARLDGHYERTPFWTYYYKSCKKVFTCKTSGQAKKLMVDYLIDSGELARLRDIKEDIIVNRIY